MECSSFVPAVHYKYNSLWKKKYFCSVKVQCEFYSDKLYSYFVSCFDKKHNRKIITRKRSLQDSTKVSDTVASKCCVSSLNQYSSHPAYHHQVVKPSGPCPELISYSVQNMIIQIPKEENTTRLSLNSVL